MELFRVFSTLVLEDGEFHSGINRAQGAFGGIVGTIAKGAVAIGGALAGVGASAILTGNDMANSLNVIGSQTGATEADITRLEGSVRRLATQQGRFDAQQMTSALENIAIYGREADEMFALLEYGMQLSKATGAELDDGLGLLGLALDKAGKDSRSAGRYMNVFAQLMRETNLPIGMVEQSIVALTPAMNQWDISLEQTSGWLARLKQEGLYGASATSGLSYVFRDLAGITPEMAKRLQSLGVDVFDMNGNFNEGYDVLNQLKGAMSTMNDRELADFQQELFGANGQTRAVLTALMATSEGADEFTRRMREAGEGTLEYGVAADMARRRADRFRDSLGRMRNIGQELVFQLNDLIGAPVIGWLEDIVTKTGEFLQTEAGLGTISSVISTVGEAFFGVTKVVGELGRALLPVVSDTLPWLLDVFNQVVDIFVEWIQILAPMIQDHLPTFLDIATRIVDIVLDLARAFTPIVENLLPPLLSIVGTLADVFLDWIQKALIPLIENILPPLISALSTVVTWLAENEWAVRGLLGVFLAFKGYKGVMGVVATIKTLKIALQGLAGAKYFGAVKKGITTLTGVAGFGKLKTTLTGVAGTGGIGKAGGAIGLFKTALLGVAAPITATIGLVGYIAYELHKYGLSTKTMGEETTRVFEEMYAEFSTNLTGMSNVAREKFNEIYEATGDKSKAIRIAVLYEMGIMESEISVHLTNILKENFDFWEEMYEVTGNVVEATHRTVSNHYGYMTRDVMKEMGAFSPQVQSVWDRVYEETGNSMLATQAVVNQGYLNTRTDVLTTLGKMKTDAREAGEEITNGLDDGIQTGTPRALEGVRTLGESVLTAFRLVTGIQSPSTVFYGYGENIADGLMSGVNDSEGRVNETFASFGRGLMNSFRSMLGISSPSTEFETYGKNIVTGLRNGVNNSRREATGAIERVGTGILNTFNTVTRARDSASSVFSRFGRNMVFGVRDGLNTNRDSARNSMERVGNSVLTAFDSVTRSRNGASSVFDGFGRNITSGLVNGLNSGSGGVTGTISSIASNMLGSFRSILGISSPSREFKAFGYNIIDGLQDGIEENSKTAIDSIKELAKGVGENFLSELPSHLDDTLTLVKQFAQNVSDELENIGNNVTKSLDGANLQLAGAGSMSFGVEYNSQPSVLYGRQTERQEQGNFVTRDELASVIESLKNIQVTMDSRKVVGSLKSELNKHSNDESALARRGVISE